MFSRSIQIKFSLKMYIFFSLKVLRVEKQNKNKIQNGNFIFLEGLKS